LLSGSTGVYRKHRWHEATFLPLSLVLSSRSRPNPPSLIPGRFIHLDESAVSANGGGGRGARGSEGKEGTGCIPVINFRPSAGVATRHHPGPPSTAASFVILYREYEGCATRDAYGGLARPFSTGGATKLLDYSAFYFHEFRGTSARNHNQPRTPYHPSLAYYGLLVAKVTIATRRDGTVSLPLPSNHLTVTYPKVSRSEISAGVHPRGDNRRRSSPTEASPWCFAYVTDL